MFSNLQLWSCLHSHSPITGIKPLSIETLSLEMGDEIH